MGTGKVPSGFYRQTSGQWFSSTSVIDETCRSCNGTGIIIVPDFVGSKPFRGEFVQDPEYPRPDSGVNNDDDEKPINIKNKKLI